MEKDLTHIKELKFDKKNARKHNERNLAMIETSLKEVGAARSIVIDEDNNILAGNGTVEAAGNAGIENLKIVETTGNEIVAVRRVGLTDEQKKKLALYDNRTAELAEWNAEVLEELEKEIDLSDVFSEKELKGIKDALNELQEVTEDETPEVPTEAKTKRGDIYELGGHRVMCGDSTNADDVAKLMNGQKADMVFTDPPYNVDYVGKTKDSLKIKNDKKSSSDFYNLLFNSFKLLFDFSKDGTPIYVCNSFIETMNFVKSLKDANWNITQCIIWVKNTFVMGRQDYQWQHEPILYGWKGGSAHKWYGGRKDSTIIKSEDGVFFNKTENGFFITFNNGLQKIVISVPSYELVFADSYDLTTTWFVNKPIRNGEHPTQKPVALIAKAVNNSSKKENLVIDLFLGSGTTLIACEQLKRKCYGMELDEKYCDVIVSRYCNFTKNNKIKLNGEEIIWGEI